jgi:hypothetical protein
MHKNGEEEVIITIHVSGSQSAVVLFHLPGGVDTVLTPEQAHNLAVKLNERMPEIDALIPKLRKKK